MNFESRDGLVHGIDEIIGKSQFLIIVVAEFHRLGGVKEDQEVIHLLDIFARFHFGV